MKKIFVFAYYSIKDPVFISATLDYLLEANKTNHRFEFHLLTFEHDGFSITDVEIEKTEKVLKGKNIYWYRSKWRSGGLLKPIWKIIDLIQGIAKGREIIVANHCEMIFSEGVVGASIGYFISKISRKPHIIHSFEPHADAMKEGGVWSSWSWEFHLLKHFEKRLGRSASTLITGTEAYKSEIELWGVSAKIYVIPSCVDTSRFQYFSDRRKEIRQAFSISEDTIVIAYLGKFGGMYMESELFEFFKNCEQHPTHKFQYWIFSGNSPDWINDQFNKYDIPQEKTFVNKLTKQAIPGYLSAADIGMVAVRPLPSKRYCSPIKTGEYWACGLPALIPKGIGDDYLMVDSNPQLGQSVTNMELFQVDKAPERITDADLRATRGLEKYIDRWQEALRSTE